MEKIKRLLLRFLSPHKMCTRFVLSAMTCLVLWLVHRSDRLRHLSISTGDASSY